MPAGLVACPASFEESVGLGERGGRAAGALRSFSGGALPVGGAHRAQRGEAAAAGAAEHSELCGTNHCGAAVLTGGLPNIIAVSALHHCGIDITWGLWFLRRLSGRMAPVYWILSIVGNTSVLLCFTRSADFGARQSSDFSAEEGGTAGLDQRKRRRSRTQGCVLAAHVV
eukprot:Skav216924  [mRNA]  locus=scaffold1838:346809:349961:- [translate_table: standard]